MAKQGSVSSSARGLSRSFLRESVLSLALLSAVMIAPAGMAFAGEALPPPTPSSSGSLPSASSPATNSTMGQMMAMQQAAMSQSNSTPSDFEGNVPKSTSLSANFAWMDTFDNSVFNGGYGGGVTVTHWVTSKFALIASIEIESFGLSNTNNVASSIGGPSQAGTPVIPITLGGLYDFTGGKNYVNPQVFIDGGPAVTLNGESMPLYADIGVGVSTPLAKLSNTLDGIDLFANIRMAYLSNMGGLADSAVAVSKFPSAAPNAMGQNMFFMPIEFGATFVF
ncbi:MAG: hypothetical protein VST70_08560 [Nitrospirota bacterium]|nr:hypothetical protein [Nitrospirota bacterium]